MERLALTVSALLMVVPALTATVIGLALALPVLLRQMAAARTLPGPEQG
jgi:UPF0716 family protein affecting phage T7 exclusion